MDLTGQPKRLSYNQIFSRAIRWAFLFLVVGVGGDYLADHLGLQRDLIYLNDIGSAVFVAIIIVVYERRRNKRIEERLEIIREMNHHVRNALQVISFSPHAAEREERVLMMQEAVARIEWALREILPSVEGSKEFRKDPLIDPRLNRPTQ